MPTLTIGGATFQTSDWQTQVIAAPTGLAHLPPNQWGYSLNLMTGWKNAPGSAGPDGRVPRHFSESQLEVIGDFLHFEHPFIQKNIDLFERADGTLPVGASQSSLTSNRPLLGKAQDDFLWWSNGKLTGEFSFAKETKNLGPGYRPVAGDFDGDGDTDIFWYRNEAERWVDNFGYSASTGSWRIDTHPRVLADVNGDGKDDVVGFSNSGVWVAPSTGSRFLPMSQWVSGYGYSNGWRLNKHLRVLAEVDGDERMVVVGFAHSGV